ncbi:acyltransferase family protein [Paraburkholderia piptadeniae]|uniref:acyltransferase family protein n=1 Tax=Paraburkholderia piptadeniae TaxID=1701573 RepID=UPI00117DF954|nr:acyltransferase family protein [Paraburkholderia piptadeniae]
MHFLDGPPLLPNGKVDRLALKRLAQAHTPMPAVVESAPQSGEEAALIGKWAAIFPGETLSARNTFKSLGGDSLSYVEAYLAAEALPGTLPADWADQPIARLARLRRTGHSFWAVIDSTIVIRCVAILMIIAYHAQLFPGGNGLTSVFFLISGYVFGTLKLPADLREFRAADSLSAMKRIFVPALVFALLTCAIKVALGKRFPTEALQFYANWIDYAELTAHGGQVEPLASIFWYVDSLLQVIALTTLAALAAKFLSRAASVTIRATRFAVCLFALGVVLRVAFLLALHPEYFRTGIEELSVWQLSSLGNLAPFALGMTLTQWIRGGNRVMATIVLLAYGLVDAQIFGLYRGLAMAFTGLCMVWQPTIRVPRFAARFIRTIAGSALFIYLSHQIFFATANGLLRKEMLVVDLLAGILGGVAVSLLWSRFERGLNAMGGFVLRMTGVDRQG